MDFRDQFGVNLDGWRVITLQYAGAALAHLSEQPFNIQSKVLPAVSLQVATTGVIQLSGAQRVAIAEVMEANGNLDQTLIEATRRIFAIKPKFLPNFMGFEKIAPIEFPDSFQVARIVRFGVHLATFSRDR